MFEFKSDNYLKALNKDSVSKLCDAEIIGLLYQFYTISSDCFDCRSSQEWRRRAWNLF